jgi:hypothetical protein
MKSPNLIGIVKKFDQPFSRIYADNLGLLRPLWLLIVVLCLSIPLTQFPLNLVVTDTLSGFKGSAPTWSILLWMVGVPLAWAALLTGSALSNRLVFAAVAVSSTFFLSVCVITLPRDYFNALVGVTALVALGFCERNLKSKETRLTMPLLNSVVVGAAAGSQIVILTPLKPLIAKLSTLPGPLLGIGGGAILGIGLGLITLWWARLPRDDKRFLFFRGAHLSVRPTLWTMFTLLAVFLFAGYIRGGLCPSAGLALSSLVMTNTYLWPFWYVAGVVLLHSILGTTENLSISSNSFVPKAISIPLIVLFLVAGFVISLSETIVLYLSNHPGAFTNGLLPPFFSIYLHVKPYVWSNPLNVATVHWLSWVFGFDVVAMIALALQKRLTSSSLIRLFLITIFAALLISEYVLQTSSFSRRPADAVVMLFLLVLWLLWFLHKASVFSKPQSSPVWPSKGKVAIWCAISALIVLDIHGRTASKDFRLLNEVFITMFRGVLAIGLPYSFLVGFSKKNEEPPVRVSTMVGLFSAGVVTALTLNAMEKFACANWLVIGTMKIVKEQINLMQTSGTANFDILVPTSWIIARTFIYVLTLLVLCFIAKERLYDKRNSSATILLVLLTFASGVAAFSRTLIELPLPLEIRALTAPLVEESTFNCSVLQTYLSCLVPALILGIAQFSDGKRAFIVYPAAIILAGWTSCSIALMYTQNIVIMRATGLVYPVATMSCGIFVVLATIAFQLAKRSIAEETPDSVQAPHSTHTQSASQDNSAKRDITPVIITPRSLVISVLLIEAFTLPIVIKQSGARFENQPIEALHHKLLLSTDWEHQPPEPGKSPFLLTTLKRHNADGDSSLLQLATVKSDPQGSRALLRTLLTSAIKSNRFPNFNLVSAETWNKYAPNALVCQFAYEGKEASTMSGLIVLVPLADGKSECYSLFGPRHEVEREKWELAHAVSKLAGIGH